MKAGWVIATPGADGWNYLIAGPSAEIRRESGDDPDLASRLLAEGDRIGLIAGHDAAPLIAVPCNPVTSLVGIPDDGAWKILPRFSQENPLMLSGGEELLLAGALSIAPNFDGCILIRGRGRALWVQISAGEVISFLASAAPSMRGIFAPGRPVTETHDVAIEAAADTLSRPERLGQHLAAIPALRRLRGLDAEQISQRVAGWIFGAELASAKAWWLGQQILLITDEDDGAAEILRAQGAALHLLPSDAALLAGLKAVAPL